MTPEQLSLPAQNSRSVDRREVASADYVLVTAAKNEARLIRRTLESVVRQEIRPKEWVVVSDGSTDETEAIVREYADRYDFIRLLALPANAKRSFSSVVFAQNAGINALRTKEYEFIGLLDADVQFPHNYFADLISEFRKNSRLGLAGGLALDLIDGKHVWFRQNLNEVAGAVHFFRRTCFEAIGGLVPIPEGGWDTITNVMARAMGYKTRTFSHLIVDHLKPRNTGEGAVFRRKWQQGERDYAVGNDFLFELGKCTVRVRERPWGLASALRFGAFVACTLRGKQRHIPEDYVREIRRQQRNRMLRYARLQWLVPGNDSPYVSGARAAGA
jgi:poly-beta-1,6-N-acetyl-D-glucosamine synthase